MTLDNKCSTLFKMSYFTDCSGFIFKQSSSALDEADVPYLTHLHLDKMATILADDIFICIFLNENDRIPIQISLMFVPRSSVDKKTAFVQVMAWRRTDQWWPNLLTHIWGTRGIWVRRQALKALLWQWLCRALLYCGCILIIRGSCGLSVIPIRTASMVHVGTNRSVSRNNTVLFLCRDVKTTKPINIYPWYLYRLTCVTQDFRNPYLFVMSSWYSILTSRQRCLTQWFVLNDS